MLGSASVRFRRRVQPVQRNGHFKTTTGRETFANCATSSNAPATLQGSPPARFDLFRAGQSQRVSPQENRRGRKPAKIKNENELEP